MIKSCLDFILVIFIAMVAASCQEARIKPTKNSSTTAPIDSGSIKVFQCQEPRLQMCTREYRPVCARRDTGIRCVTTPCPSTEKVTKSNACTACADKKVLDYVLGACS